MVFSDCVSCTRTIFTNAGFMEAGEYGPTRDACRAEKPRGGSGRRGAVDIVVCFGCGGIFSRFFSEHVSRLSAHGLLHV